MTKPYMGFLMNDHRFQFFIFKLLHQIFREQDLRRKKPKCAGRYRQVYDSQLFPENNLFFSCTVKLLHTSHVLKQPEDQYYCYDHVTGSKPEVSYSDFLTKMKRLRYYFHPRDPGIIICFQFSKKRKQEHKRPYHAFQEYSILKYR